MQGLRFFIFVSVESFSVPVVLSDLLSPIVTNFIFGYRYIARSLSHW